MKPIRTKKQYESALGRLEKIFNAKRGTKEFDEAEVLILLIEDYESRNFPIEAPDPVEALKFYMEQRGLTNEDLTKALGYKTRVTEVMNRKRKLNLRMIRNLNKQFKMPLEVLVREY